MSEGDESGDDVTNNMSRSEAAEIYNETHVNPKHTVEGMTPKEVSEYFKNLNG